MIQNIWLNQIFQPSNIQQHQEKPLCQNDLGLQYFLINNIYIMIDAKDTKTSLVKRIRQHGTLNKIEQLCLDEIQFVYFIPAITTIIQTCTRLEYLSLCSCRLNTLDFFPSLPKLITLQLTNNQIQGEHLQPLSKLNNLSSLTLDNNKIADFGWLRFFKRTKIASLCLKDNPITQAYSQKQYRERIYRGFSNDLEYLDGQDRQGNQPEQQQSSDSDLQPSQNMSKSARNESYEESFGSQNEQSLSMRQVEAQIQDDKEEDQNKMHKKLKKQESIYPIKQEQ